MLTFKQSRNINQYGLATLHDYWTESLSSGEPFFEDGVLTYFDGRAVTLCGFPLRGDAPITGLSVRHLSQQLVVRLEAEAIIYIGPNRVDLRHLKEYGFRCTTDDGGADISSELLIDCSCAPGTVHNLPFYKRAIKTGLKSKFRSGGIVPADYFKLIEAFYLKVGVTRHLARMAFALPVLLRSRRVRLVEAWLGDQLCGFSTLHRAFSDTAVGLFLAHDFQTPGVSDFLYGETIIHAQKLGISRINIGPSPSYGHYNFKCKWGGEPLVPPYYYIEWARGRLARRYHTSWGPRIVKL